VLTTGARTFFAVPAAIDLANATAQVAFLGVPFDGGTPQPGNRTGQKLGPAAARQASWEQCAYGESVEDGADDAANRIVGQEAAFWSRRWPSLDQLPLAAGVAARRRVEMVHVDAHADCCDELDGARLNRARQLRRMAELPDVAGVTALGLRNVEREEVDAVRGLGVRFATTLDLLDRGPAAVVDELVPSCDAIYVSVDLDVLDLVPGTTLRGPGGLSYRDPRATLAAVARRGRVEAFDIAELNAPADISGATARLATGLITHLLSELFD
jgi:agmatinase